MAMQASLFQNSCPCDRPIQKAGRCLGCYNRIWYDSRFFLGQRREVLERDERRCRICKAPQWLNVHHRRYAQFGAEDLVTLCVGCHMMLHNSKTLKAWIPTEAWRLWVELHPERPVQLQFEI